MPKRTTDFQTIVELLERQLAPGGARVYGSHMLTDTRTGEEREVDIVIETTSGIHPIRIGIEVIDHKRPATTPWVEQIRSKHDDLQIHKTILVSRSGYYRPALKKARTYKMDTLTIKEAEETDWKSTLDETPFVRLVSFSLPQPTHAWPVFDESSSDVFAAEDLAALEVFNADGSSRGSLTEMVDGALADTKVLSAIAERAFVDSGTIVELEIRFQRGCYALDDEQRRHPVHGLKIEARCRKEEMLMDLEKGRYGGAAAVAASGESFRHPVQIVLSQTEEQEHPVGAVRIERPKKRK